MEKKTFSTIDGQRAELETKLIEAVFRGDLETVGRITAQLTQSAELRLVPSVTSRPDPALNRPIVSRY